VAVLMNIQRGEPDLAGIDPTRTALLRRMLEKDPRRRPSAREVLEIARGVQFTDSDATAATQAPTSDTTQPVRVGSAPARPARRFSWRRPAAVVAAAVLALVVGYLGFSAVQDGPGKPAQQSQSPEPTTVESAPGNPGSDQLRSGNWLLSQYSISQDGGNLVINGTVVNSGPKAASTDLTVYYYVGGEAVAVATGSTGRVAAGGSTSVTLTSDDPWQPGNPVLVVEAS